MLDHPDLQSFFETQKLREAGKALREKYVNAEPYPHIVLNDFFPETVASELTDAFELPNDENWGENTSRRYIKRNCNDETIMDTRIQAMLYKLKLTILYC